MRFAHRRPPLQGRRARPVHRRVGTARPPSPEAAADRLRVLVDGVLVDGVLAHAVTRTDAHPARAARRLAAHVLDARD
ncbi:hypothetical protein [Streptomyces griseosporeus]|uniref:hypothetical protein n=1 Tax=Streptomyces griseosporeus TaxID=1910 RepID=UPI0036FF0F7A